MSENEKQGEKKLDIKALVAVIPPASSLGKEKVRREKRIRVRALSEIKEGFAKINPELAKELGITSSLEVVVARKRKLKLTAIMDENVPVNEVWCNLEQLKEEGIADNSIATVRAAK